MAREPLLSVTKKDLTIEYFNGRGGGGQHRDKKATCCRLTHSLSGAQASSCDDRSREQNKKAAFVRLTQTQKFVAWRRKETARALGVTDQRMSLQDENLLVEVRKHGKWVKV